MKCSKCGCEYQEGRSCPRCGENGILIHDDYFRRKEEWERRNQSKTEKEIKAPYLSPEKKRRLIKGAGFGTGIILLCWLVLGSLMEYQRTHPYKLSYGALEDWVYSPNGVFAYPKQQGFFEERSQTDSIACSENGKVLAMTTYDASTSKYLLWIQKDQSRILAYESDNPLFIQYVRTDGMVYLLEMEYGEFGSILSKRAMEIGSSVRILSEEDVDYIDTGIDGKISIWDDRQGVVQEIWNNNRRSLVGAGQPVYTQKELYYLEQQSLYNGNHECIDQGITKMYHVYGTNELVYFKDNQMFLIENTGNTVTFKLEGHSFENQGIWMRIGDSLVCWSKNNAYRFSCRKGMLIHIGTERPYLSVKF